MIITNNVVQSFMKSTVCQNTLFLAYENCIPGRKSKILLLF